MRLKLLIALAFLAGAGAPVWAADAPLPGPVTGPAQQPPKPQPDYHCPPTAYINCMPPITEDRRQSCSKDYIAWVQSHCPNSQVVY
jgi:hypothetical protein